MPRRRGRDPDHPLPSRPIPVARPSAAESAALVARMRQGFLTTARLCDYAKSLRDVHHALASHLVTAIAIGMHDPVSVLREAGTSSTQSLAASRCHRRDMMRTLDDIAKNLSPLLDEVGRARWIGCAVPTRHATELRNLIIMAHVRLVAAADLALFANRLLAQPPLASALFVSTHEKKVGRAAMARMRTVAAEFDVSASLRDMEQLSNHRVFRSPGIREACSRIPSLPRRA